MPNMRERVVELEARRASVREMGGAEKIAKQHARGKMTARERLAAFFDDGAFVEVGAHGTQMGLAAGPDGRDKPAADGVVTAFGKVDGRMVTCAAYDFTVKGGSIGYTGEEKVTRLRSMALKGRWPIVCAPTALRSSITTVTRSGRSSAPASTRSTERPSRCSPAATPRTPRRRSRAPTGGRSSAATSVAETVGLQLLQPGESSAR